MTGDVILGTMMFNVFFQMIFEAFIHIMRMLRARFDSKGPNGSRQHSIHSYMNVHGGLAFERHWRYALMMNVVFITMVFGTGLPLLFPIAAFSILVYYIQQIYMIHTSYKVSPTYDQELNDTALKYLKLGPLLLLSCGFW